MRENGSVKRITRTDLKSHNRINNKKNSIRVAQNTHAGQCNITDSPYINSHICCFRKIQKYTRRKRQHLQSCWENWMAKVEGWQQKLIFSHSTKLHFKCIKYVSIKPDIMKYLERKLASPLQHVGAVKDFLNRTPVAQKIKATNNKCNLVSWEGFYRPKETISWMKRQSTEWKKIFANCISDIDR